MSKAKHKKLQQTQNSAATFQAMIRASPLPPPEEMARFEQICPGAANRILVQFENQATHRQELETMHLKANLSKEEKSMYVSAFITTLLMLIGGMLLYQGKQTEGLLATFGPSVFVAGSFAYKKYDEHRSKQDREHKATAN